MIKWLITRDNDLVNIDIKGHAGYAKRGQDIVCSSVSTMVYFFITCVKQIDDTSIKHLKLKSGDAQIKLNTNLKIEPLLEGFQISLREVEKQYPQCLKEGHLDD